MAILKTCFRGQRPRGLAISGKEWHDVSMDVLVTGIGDAFSSLWYGSSALVRAPHGWIAIDCPGAVLRAWREASEQSETPVDPLEVRDIILTHLHGDHCAGLETIGFLHRYRSPGDGPGPRPRLHAIPEVLARTWERLAPAMDGSGSSIDTYFELHELDEATASPIAGCEVQCRRTRHTVPTAGLMLDAPDGRLGWSSDTEFDPGHIEWLSSADCIIHECGEGPKHTSFEELGTLSESIRSRMRLLHRPDSAPPVSGHPALLTEGELLSVSSSG